MPAIHLHIRKFFAWAGFAAWLLVVLLLMAAPARADRIVLRNLTILSDRTVTSFDEDGVRLSNGTLLTWDEIERAKISEDKQAAFDRMLGELGNHLYRIRQRLSVGDYEGLLPHAEAVAKHYQSRHSATAYMVQQALMWGRLAAGQRESALAPYLRCYEYLRNVDPARVKLPGKRRLKFDLTTGLTPELPPVWFDADAVRKVMPDVLAAVSSLSKPRPPAARIYYATLALAAGDQKMAARVLKGLDKKNQSINELREIVTAQGEFSAGHRETAIARLTEKLPSISAENRPLALYWLGLARLEGDKPSQEQGVLDLLRLPALYGEQSPDLAAAGLYHAMEQLKRQGDAPGSVAVRNELLRRYGQSYHAAQVNQGKKRTSEESEK